MFSWKVNEKSYERYYCLFTKEEMSILLKKAGFILEKELTVCSSTGKYGNVLFIARKP